MFNDSEQIIQKLIFILGERFLLHAEIGIELEFYILNSDYSPVSEENGQILLDLIVAQGFACTKEKGNGQYEISFHNTLELISLWKHVLQTKAYLKELALSNELDITFAPKPFKNDFGSATHYHVSLHNANGANVFQNNEINDNRALKYAIAGILELVNPSLYLFTQGDDSEFARFIPKFMAPINVSWGGNNRTTVIRIPESIPKYRRIEFRLPSASSSVYDSILFLLTAIIYGLESKKDPIPRVYGNADHSQYVLTPLWSNNVDAKKHFYFDKIIDNYI